MTRFSDVERLLKETMGLDAASVGSFAIQRSVRLQMAKIGLHQIEDYWQHLCRSTDELQELIETVVVPETWFFRDEEAFVALARLVIEEWRPLHPASVLRVLSLPCSTGEEPYSIIMALLDAGLALDQLQVDAVDISARALDRAKRGRFGSNSFRGRNQLFRERYFQAGEHGYVLADSLRGKVNFRQGNLLSSDFQAGAGPYDVVFCRNLLIYFDRSTQEQALRTLRSMLARSGFLFVGPAEAFLASWDGFVPVNQAMSFAFRSAPAKLPTPSEVYLPNLAKPVTLRVQPKGRAPNKSGFPVSPPKSPTAPPDGLQIARRMADAGQLLEAAEACESHLRKHGASAEAYYLLGLTRDAMGDQRAATESYRKTLYLECDHAEALIHLALLTEAHGDVAGAGRLRERARRANKTFESKSREAERGL